MSSSISLPWLNTPERYDVSVIVPTYNRAHYLGECLDSLLNQTCPANEIIVIDDGSEDETANLVRRYGDKISYVHKDNGGKSSAVNLGLSLAQGNLIWLFDDDDVALPEAIENRVVALKGRPDVGFVYSPHYLGMDGPDGRIVKTHLNYLPIYDEDAFFMELAKGCFFHLATALVRIEAYRSVGGFDIALLRSQDYDMQIRLAHDFNAAFSPEPSFIFRQHMGVRGTKRISHAEGQRSKLFQKYDQQIGIKLRSALSLEEYLVPRSNGVETDEKRRKALLTRMAVMASKGCVAEMLEDLKTALETLHPGQLLCDSEIRQITTSICTGYAYEAIQADWATFRTRLELIDKHGSGKQARLAVAKGFLHLAKSYPGTVSDRLRKFFIAAEMALGLV